MTTFPESIGPIFCFGTYDDKFWTIDYARDPSKFSVDTKFIGRHRLLLELGVTRNDDVPEIAAGSFLWCGLGDNASIPFREIKIHGFDRLEESEVFLIRLELKDTSRIYVVDHAPWEKRREELDRLVQDYYSRQFTKPEMEDFVLARAQTIIPIAEYRGNYEKPVVLVRRPLSIKEIRVVHGP